MEEKRILEIHNTLFTYLSELHEKDSSFRFSLRKSDLGQKLTRGYWFYGGKEYVAVSFWNGFDGVNNTPNISFIINFDFSCELLIISKDSSLKQFFFINKLHSKLPKATTYHPNEYRLLLSNKSDSNYLSCLEEFINGLKIEIDVLIKEEKQFLESNNVPEIGFINGHDFNLVYNRIKKRVKQSSSFKSQIDAFPIVNLKSFKISNFGPIKEIDIPDFGKNKHWIFLTGENGGGKSAIFKAITSCIANDHKYLTQGDYSNYEVNIELVTQQRNYKRDFKASKAIKSKLDPLYKGFAAYGASRLRIKKEIGNDVYYENSISICDSIFDFNSELLDFWLGISKLQLKTQSSIAKTRIANVREVLYKLIENLLEIYMPGEFDAKETFFREKESSNEAKPFDPVPYDYLASGIRSIIAMIGDLMLRLFEQQKSVISPSELTGIVIIDEIDVHLHPIYQKKIVEKLTLVFPRIQFIVSTHSPIPLLGAPESSICYIVKRDYDLGVYLQHFEDIKFNELLPNTLFTSPIFGMESIFPISQNDPSKVKTEKSWNEVKLNKKIKLELDEIYKSLKD